MALQMQNSFRVLYPPQEKQNKEVFTMKDFNMDDYSALKGSTLQKLETEVPCETRTAGLIIYYPLSMILAYGI